MANYNWKEFETKYDGAIRGIAKATNCDMGVARDKLVYMVENPDGEKYDGVPQDFDWVACRDDLAAVRAQFK